MLSEFQSFLSKFNVIPQAVAFVLGLAFQPMVDSVVQLILSLIAALIGAKPNDEGVYVITDWAPGGFPVGDVINAAASFVLIAFIVFMLIRALNRAGATTTSGPSTEEQLLTDIRDILADGKAGSTPA